MFANINNNDEWDDNDIEISKGAKAIAKYNISNTMMQ
jgi:hypothetical protein